MADKTIREDGTRITTLQSADSFGVERDPDAVHYYTELQDVRVALEVGGAEELQIGGAQVTTTVTEAGHGIGIGPVGHNGSAWVAADATFGENPCLAFCVEVVDVDNIKIATTGVHTLTAHGYGTGQKYLDTTPGDLRDTPTPGTVVQRVLVGIDSNTVLLGIGDPQQ